MASSEHGALVERMVKAIPALAARHRCHVDQYGEILSHGFFANEARELIRRVQTVQGDIPGAGLDPVSMAVLDFIEAELRGGEYVPSEVIGLSFVEIIDWGSREGAAVRAELGPCLEKEVSALGG